MSGNNHGRDRGHRRERNDGPVALAFDESQLQFLTDHHHAAMITFCADGTPHVAQVGIGLVDGLRSISDQLTSGNIEIPSPPDGVKGWPFVGQSLYDLWKMASENLDAALRELAPILKPLAGPRLHALLRAR